MSERAIGALCAITRFRFGGLPVFLCVCLAASLAPTTTTTAPPPAPKPCAYWPSIVGGL